MRVKHFQTRQEVKEFDDWETNDQLMFHTKESVSELLKCSESYAEVLLEDVLDEGLVPTDSALEHRYSMWQAKQAGLI